MRQNSEKKNPENKRKNRFLIAFSLVFVQLLLVGVIGYFLMTKFFGPKTLAQYLPAENTIAFAEILVDPQEQQVKKISENLKNYPAFNNASIQALLTSMWPDYQQITPWLGRKIGIALIQANAPTQQASPVLFVEVKNFDTAVNFLKQKALNADDFMEDDYTFPGFKLYSYKAGQRFQALQIDNYLVFADNAEVLKQIADAKNNRIAPLKNDETYNQVQNGLPTSGLGFLYMNNEKTLQSLLKNEQYTQANISSLNEFLPFIQIFSAEGTAIIADDNGLKIQDQTILNKAHLPNGKLLSFNTKYQGKLLQLLPEQPTMLFAGRDLTSELESLKTVFSSDKTTTSLLFQGYLNQAKDLILDQSLDLEADVLPLLKGEYALSITKKPEGDSWLALFEITDPTGVADRLQKIENAVQKHIGIFAPHEAILTLQDGTTGKIIQASTDIQKSTQNYGGYNIDVISASASGPSFYFVITKDNLLFANNLATLQSVIDKMANTAPTSTISALPKLSLNNADEVIFLDFSSILAQISEQNPLVKVYTQPFQNLTLTREYSENKIISTALIEIK